MIWESYNVIKSGIVIDFKLVHLSKTPFPNDVTEFGRFISDRLLQLTNAVAEIVIICSGIIIFVSAVHPENVETPIFETESGNAMLVILSHNLKETFATDEMGPSNKTNLI